MGFDDAIRLTEILLGFAFLLQSAEHISAPRREQILFLPRIFLSALLILGIASQWVCLGLMALSLLILARFDGPYNGGSDRMGLLILCCLSLAHNLPSPQWQEYAFGYLAIQLLLSYCIAGWVKIINPDWRSGRALQDVFQFSAYPVSDAVRSLAGSPKLLFVMSWAVIVFEILFPLTLITQSALLVALILGMVFHLANACLFGLNRFFWIWLAAYPSIIWFQGRIFDVGPWF